MSVAFRRESDEEHLEPKFEVPIPPGPNLVTPRGMEIIGERIAALEGALENAVDEAAANSAKRDLRYWRARLSTADVQTPASCETVHFGCKVAFTLNGKAREITIVGHDEADPANGLLAFTAPLARAMMGASPGDIVDFNGREDAIAIVAIRPA
ncbi:GreA/GreB family elongation factor [Novosphingobium sp. Leaf2]|uniref:GreA/GreB family elongation factor n=1 Tax=Novosphingobium sp. Leaf2 TaxID=1735670 RepID=UPI000700A7F5|nr:GreA/GreB family elongation factor [Novosphingobium sp. Leaf2]KQM13030.1 nucleoside diphosphate kinase [Novosphingobium sp. Leaf2]